MYKNAQQQLKHAEQQEHTIQRAKHKTNNNL